MKILSHLLLLTVVTLTIVFPALSQKKDDVLGSNASLQEVQKWLVKTIGKNSTHEEGKWEKKTSGLKFDGCRFSYTLSSEID